MNHPIHDLFECCKAGDQGMSLAKPAGVGYLLTGESVRFFAVFDIL